VKNSRAPRLVIVGSSNTDLVLQCARLPRPGESLLGGEFARYAGGKGANQAVAAARAGAAVSFVGRYGEDDFGRAAKAGLRREGIDVRHFRSCGDAPSGIALILIGGRSRENLIGVARSANDWVSPEDVEAAGAVIAEADAVLCQLEVPLAAVEAAAALAVVCGVPFILNPAPGRKLPARLLQRVHTLTPNETEMETLTGQRDVRKAARLLRRRGCKQVVVTMGARGAWICSAEEEGLVKTRKVKPVDTVGAGDCFSAWVTVGIAEGLGMAAAVERAVRAAAMAVTRTGAQAAMPFRREVMGKG
jgi:ribokinase